MARFLAKCIIILGALSPFIYAFTHISTEAAKAILFCLAVGAWLLCFMVSLSILVNYLDNRGD